MIFKKHSRSRHGHKLAGRVRAFSVSASQLQSVVRYINHQGSYDKKITFQREYLALLKKHGVDYDPRYVFG
jgi:putative transposase